jgi:hypothetical protein
LVAKQGWKTSEMSEKVRKDGECGEGFTCFFDLSKVLISSIETPELIVLEMVTNGQALNLLEPDRTKPNQRRPNQIKSRLN